MTGVGPAAPRSPMRVSDDGRITPASSQEAESGCGKKDGGREVPHTTG
jgi:hypothetical protein